MIDDWWFIQKAPAWAIRNEILMTETATKQSSTWYMVHEIALTGPPHPWIGRAYHSDLSCHNPDSPIWFGQKYSPGLMKQIHKIYLDFSKC